MHSIFKKQHSGCLERNKRGKSKLQFRQRDLTEGAGLSFPAQVYVSHALRCVGRIWVYSESRIQPTAPELDWRKALRLRCCPVTSG